MHSLYLRFKRAGISGVLLLAMILALAIGLSACGGDSSSDGTSEEATTAASSGGESEGESKEGEGSTVSASLAEATELWEEAAKTPIDMPMPEEAFEPGKKKAFIVMCAALGGCLRMGEAAEAGFHAMGWETAPLYDGKFVPATQAAGINQAIQQGYDAIVLTAVDTGAIQQAVHSAEEAGIPIICTQCGETPGAPKAINVTTPALKEGKVMGDYIASFMEGKGKVVGQNDKAFAVAIGRLEGISQEIPRVCPECEYEQVEVSATELSKPGPPAFLAILQNNATSELKWIVSPYDAGVVAESKTLQQQGRAEEVKTNTFDGDPAAVGLIGVEGSGVQVGIAGPYEYIGWVAADQAARLAAGKEPWETEELPFGFVTSENFDGFKNGEFPTANEFESEFEELWGAK